MTNETILPEHTQKGDMRLKDGKLWMCSDPDINRWVCPDDRGWQLVPKEIMRLMPEVLASLKGSGEDVSLANEVERALEEAHKFGEEE